MGKAQEMFEALGYERAETTDTRWVAARYVRGREEIRFMYYYTSNSGIVEKYDFKLGVMLGLTYKESVAVSKQFEEFGGNWVEK